MGDSVIRVYARATVSGDGYIARCPIPGCGSTAVFRAAGAVGCQHLDRHDALEDWHGGAAKYARFVPTAQTNHKP